MSQTRGVSRDFITGCLEIDVEIENIKIRLIWVLRNHWKNRTFDSTAAADAEMCNQDAKI